MSINTSTNCMALYLSKHQLYAARIKSQPNKDIGIIIVIPCYNEPELLSIFEALRQCDKPDCSVEIIVVINAAISSTQEVLEQNKKTFKEANTWIKKHRNNKLRFFLLDFSDLPEKHAGVGLARKIGMDEAVARFNAIQNENGVIACLDADCSCNKNYLKAVEQYFNTYPKINACSMYFEHPLEGNKTKYIDKAITKYELFLRYYVHALRYSKYPYAFYTIGSCMAVRAGIYVKQGGMNRKKAGEDFYFLHKVIPLGNFGEINATTVIPSSRDSDRVPFGTGKAISKLLNSDTTSYMAYNLNIFKDLKLFLSNIPKLYDTNTSSFDMFTKSLPESVVSFLLEQHFQSKIMEIKKNSVSKSSFLKRFYHWFNGFRVLKYVHFAQNNFYKPQSIEKTAEELLTIQGFPCNKLQNTNRLLLRYRSIDKNRI